MKIKKVSIEYIKKSKDELKRRIIELTIKNIEKYREHLNKKLYFLVNKYESSESIDKYEKLSPIKINDGLYLDELDKGLYDEDIKNIALSGPYGVGKSSILKTYISERPIYNYLNISLANFTRKEVKAKPVEDTDKTDILQELESNILKQIFYKVKHNKVPYSRYRRIKNLTNTKICLTVVGIGLLLLTGTFLYKPSKIKEILAVKKNDFTNVTEFRLTIALIVFILLSLIFLTIIIKYIKSNLRINSIKTKNMEMSKFDDKEFIFNKNIDELLYFFEVTNYDVVIFEDLDRFDNIEIFIKLRELNELINNSQQIGRKITFIYAIKDEIFENHKDRTKFFDFIIPVVPIMNSSNSAEKIKEKLKLDISDKSEQTDKLNKLIDDISIYIDDVRLVTNICNEFNMYKKILENPDIDKLFAMIVYKNIYPKDFAQLQFNKGMIADIFNFDKKQTIISKVIENIEKDCSDIEKKIVEVKKESINDIHELRMIYLEDIFKKITDGLSINGTKYDYDSLIEKIFNEETSEKNESIQYSGYYNNFTTNIRQMLNYDSKNSYYVREKLIRQTEDKEINKIKTKLSDLNKKINVINTYRIQELIQEFGIDNIITDKNTRSQNFLVYLVRNGYIDEMYDSYIVRLKSGSLTKNDVDFIKMIQGQSKYKLHYIINNPSKVISKISTNDCKTSSILNYNLIEFLILNKNNYRAHYNAILNKLSDESKESKEFINVFITSKKLGYELLSDIAKVWTSIWKYIENESNYEQDIKDRLLLHLINSLSLEYISNIDEGDILTHTISIRSNFFELVNNIEDKNKIKKLLTDLNIKFEKLYVSHPLEVYDREMIEYVYDNSLYKINKEMIEFIIGYKCGKEKIKDLDTKNYTTVTDSKCDKLIEYIDNNINTYVENILLNLSIENEKEDSIVDLLKNEKITIQNREKIIEKQSFLLYDIVSIPKELVKKIIKENKMTVDWYNISKCFNIDDETELKDDLIKYINNSHTIEKLEKEESINENHSISKEEIEKTCSNIISDGITVDTFTKLLENTINIYEAYMENKFETFIQNNIDKLDRDKIKILIDHDTIKLNVENYENIQRDYRGEYLHIELVKNHIQEYVESHNDYNLEHADLVKLLSLDISNNDKTLIVNNVYKHIVTTTEHIDERLNNIVSEYLYECNETIDFYVLKHIINRDISDDKKALVISNQVKYLDEHYIIELLRRIGNGYEYILEKGAAPKVKNNKINKRLCEELEKYDYISSWNERDEDININRKRKGTA
ncbi:MAG: hypothetical protein RR894_16135 [Terrisporobacter sp.]